MLSFYGQVARDHGERLIAHGTAAVVRGWQFGNDTHYEYAGEVEAYLILE